MRWILRGKNQEWTRGSSWMALGHLLRERKSIQDIFEVALLVSGPKCQILKHENLILPLGPQSSLNSQLAFQGCSLATPHLSSDGGHRDNFAWHQVFMSWLLPLRRQRIPRRDSIRKQRDGTGVDHYGEPFNPQKHPPIYKIS